MPPKKNYNQSNQSYSNNQTNQNNRNYQNNRSNYSNNRNNQNNRNYQNNQNPQQIRQKHYVILINPGTTVGCMCVKAEMNPYNHKPAYCGGAPNLFGGNADSDNMYQTLSSEVLQESHNNIRLTTSNKEDFEEIHTEGYGNVQMHFYMLRKGWTSNKSNLTSQISNNNSAVLSSISNNNSSSSNSNINSTNTNLNTNTIVPIPNANVLSIPSQSLAPAQINNSNNTVLSEEELEMTGSIFEVDLLTLPVKNKMETAMAIISKFEQQSGKKIPEKSKTELQTSGSIEAIRLAATKIQAEKTNSSSSKVDGKENK